MGSMVYPKARRDLFEIPVGWIKGALDLCVRYRFFAGSITFVPIIAGRFISGSINSEAFELKLLSPPRLSIDWSCICTTPPMLSSIGENPCIPAFFSSADTKFWTALGVRSAGLRISASHPNSDFSALSIIENWFLANSRKMIAITPQL
jgi:hypothetical protein